MLLGSIKIELKTNITVQFFSWLNLLILSGLVNFTKYTQQYKYKYTAKIFVLHIRIWIYSYVVFHLFLQAIKDKLVNNKILNQTLTESTNFCLLIISCARNSTIVAGKWEVEINRTNKKRTQNGTGKAKHSHNEWD